MPEKEGNRSGIPQEKKGTAERHIGRSPGRYSKREG